MKSLKGGKKVSRGRVMKPLRISPRNSEEAKDWQKRKLYCNAPFHVQLNCQCCILDCKFHKEVKNVKDK